VVSSQTNRPHKNQSHLYRRSTDTDVDHPCDNNDDEYEQRHQKYVFPPGLFLETIGILEIVVGVDEVLIGLHEFFGDDVELFSLFVDHHSHIVHDFVDAQGGLLDLVDDLVLLQHDLPLQLIVDLDLLVGQHRLLVVRHWSHLTLVQVVVVYLTAQHVAVAVLLLVLTPNRMSRKRSTSKGEYLFIRSFRMILFR
jgi:hypothetical protein